MKVRSGFVSNSSSSSFVVINDNDKSDHDEIVSYFQKNPNPVFPLKDGHREFGWDFLEYVSWKSKLNFAMIQALYSLKDGNTRHWNMFLEYLQSVGVPEESVCVSRDRYFGELPETVNCTLDDEDSYYIDRASTVVNGECTEIFESPENLKDFIESQDSSLFTGNDNVDIQPETRVVRD